MTPDLSGFAFDTRAIGLDNQRDFVAHIPAGISNRKQLFETLQRELRLPDYFGNNWDALSECLRDLSWIEQRQVAIVHDEIPQLDPKALSTYLEVLAECIRDWKADEQHELVVIFPKGARSTIEELMKL